MSKNGISDLAKTQNINALTKTSFLESSWALKAIFDEALDGILILDGIKGSILKANFAAERLLGTIEKLLVGKQISFFFPPLSRPIDEFLNHLRVHGTVFESQPFLRPNGTTIPLDVTAKLILWKNEQVIFITLRDASERLQNEEKLTQAYQLLEKKVEERTAQLAIANQKLTKQLAQEKNLHELKSNFVSMVSHEFRTPLGIILSSAGILERYDDRIEASERREHISYIQTAVQRMARLMEDVLWLGKIESAKLQCKTKSIDLLLFCQELIEQLPPELGAKERVRFSNSIEAVPVLGDETLLRLIFQNLLSNALKYSEKNKPVAFRVTQKEDLYSFEIADQGIGIAASDFDKIFEPFQRGKNVAQVSGNGLGLLITKKCVCLHGGELSFQSAEKEGTSFIVTLPLEKADPVSK